MKVLLLGSYSAADIGRAKRQLLVGPPHSEYWCRVCSHRGYTEECLVDSCCPFSVIFVESAGVPDIGRDLWDYRSAYHITLSVKADIFSVAQPLADTMGRPGGGVTPLWILGSK